MRSAREPYWTESKIAPLAIEWQRAGARVGAVPGLLWEKVHEAIDGFCGHRYRTMDHDELGDMVAEMTLHFVSQYLRKWNSRRGTLFAYVTCYASTKSTNWRRARGRRARLLLAVAGWAVLEAVEGHEPLNPSAHFEATTLAGLARQQKKGGFGWVTGGAATAAPDARIMELEAARYRVTSQPAGEFDEQDHWTQNGG
ncbi:MAG: hypothetical protein NTY46_02905 [Candidatus Sumerlaeota bacterium]|nr:hypothetical protein [Candidatus Sumerlaeota bacterium]